jgi:hypothetical protein
MDEVLESMFREIDALPDRERERILRMLEEELRQARRAVPQPGRWARLAERFSAESPLEGQSEDFLRRVREFREGFGFVEPESAD